MKLGLLTGLLAVLAAVLAEGTAPLDHTLAARVRAFERLGHSTPPAQTLRLHPRDLKKGFGSTGPALCVITLSTPCDRTKHVVTVTTQHSGTVTAEHSRAVAAHYRVA